ncbi:tRNA epoxyqueuosine(34) reductase QueG [Mariprofundus ferrinatatus]|nr:tRNA epoxyqueuosine(34) reductase QueG [Mariprofundus ferrinatatus]
MDAVSLKNMIRDKAKAHGFSLCHVTRPEIRNIHRGALEYWTNAGMQGEMAWMAEPVRLDRRKDPATMLDGVKSVISLAMRYTPPEHSLDEARSRKHSGVITAYAHGADYHDIMKKQLKALAFELDTLLGVHNQRIFVDTAPVLEHAIAESAGLGWQGKHSLTIQKNLGSWFLLGEIFTTAELEPDQPASNHCGSCSACIDICPTQAIVAPYVVDARRCISYLTIEFDGFIPRDLRPLMGNRIYGCDDCQVICPWNGHAAKEGVQFDDLLTPKGENILPDLVSLLQLDEEAFRIRFRKSPIRRTRRRGLLRNVCIAMGNSGEADFIVVLLDALHDGEPLIRGHAAWALARLTAPVNRQMVLSALAEQADHEKEPAVEQEIQSAINDIRGV